MTDFTHKSEWSRKRYAEVLTSRGWMSRRPVSFQKTLLEISQKTSFSPDENMYLVGDQANGLFGVAEGWVLVSTAGDDGQQSVIHAAGPGFWIGDLGLLAQDSRTVTVTTLTEARMLFVPTLRIEYLVHQSPSVIREFYTLSAENTRILLRITGIDRVSRSDQRVALRLVQLMEEQPEPQPWLPLTQDNLASICTMSVPSLQRALNRLTELELIETGYGGLRLLDREALAKYGQS